MKKHDIKKILKLQELIQQIIDKVDNYLDEEEWMIKY